MTFETIIEPIRRIYDLGGFVTVILVVLSIMALGVVLLKFWQFASAGVGRRRKAEAAVAAWIAGDAEKALRTAESGRGPVAEVVASAVRGVSRGNLSKETVEEDLGRIATEKLHALSKGLRLLEVIAQIAPLLGLFGTVLGMIEAFQSMQSAGTDIDPSQLAGGIWVALLTTAVGLAVAMPTQLLTTWIDGRIDNERIAMETAITAVFTRRVTDRPIGVAVHRSDGDRSPRAMRAGELAAGE